MVGVIWGVSFDGSHQWWLVDEHVVEISDVLFGILHCCYAELVYSIYCYQANSFSLIIAPYHESSGLFNSLLLSKQFISLIIASYYEISDFLFGIMHCYYAKLVYSTHYYQANS